MREERARPADTVSTVNLSTPPRARCRCQEAHALRRKPRCVAVHLTNSIAGPAAPNSLLGILCPTHTGRHTPRAVLQKRLGDVAKPPDISISSCVGLCVAELLLCFIDRSEEDLDPFHTATAMSILGRLDPAVGKIRRCGVAVSKIPDLWVRQSLASHSTEL